MEDSLPGGQPQVTEDPIRVTELGVARLDPLALLGADVEDGLGLQQQEGLHAPLLNQHAVGLDLGLVPHADVPTHGHGDNTGDNTVTSLVSSLSECQPPQDVTSHAPCPHTSNVSLLKFEVTR